MNRFTNNKKSFYQTLSLIQRKYWKTQFCMMSLWVLCFRKPCSTLCNRLLLINQSIFFSVFLPHTSHTPNRHKTVRAQGHRFVFINVCRVLNCCPLILNSPWFQLTALFRLGRKENRKKFPIISRTLISSTCAKMNHVIQHILSQPQGQKEKRKGKDMLFWPHRSTRKSLPGLPHNEKAYWLKH